MWPIYWNGRDQDGDLLQVGQYVYLLKIWNCNELKIIDGHINVGGLTLSNQYPAMSQPPFKYLNCCIDHHNLTGIARPNANYLASDYIHASNYTISPGSNVSFKAGNEIVINGEFVVNSTAEFEAKIEGCTPVSYQRIQGPTENEIKEMNPEEVASRVWESRTEQEVQSKQETALPAFSSQKFAINPNPNTGSFTLSLPNSTTPYHAIIYDLLGNIIYESTLINNQSIDISNHPKGIYFIKVSDGEQVHMNRVIHQ